MRNDRFVPLLLLLTLAPLTARATAPSTDSLLGDWHGALEAGGRALRIDVHLSRRADGGLAGTMDSPDQGALGLPLDSVVVEGDTLRFAIAMARASYRGALSAGESVVRGYWAQSGFRFPLDLGREAPPRRRRAQEPTKPYPYDEVEVRVANPAGHDTLAGTLTKPRGAGPFPAVVLITGSGPQDRDETLLGHRPFLLLADRLTRAGLAVLRCDDRGTAQSTGDIATATTADFAGDVEAEFDYLRGRADVDRAHIGLLGHSEGGFIAPYLAARRRDIAFVVMMAGPGVPGDSILILQSAAAARAAGRPDSAIARNAIVERELFAAMKAERDTAALRAKLREILGRAMEEMPAVERADAPSIEAQVAMLSTPWFRWFVVSDPRPALRKVRCPVLAVTGAKDVQVPPRENLPAIRDALRAGGNRDFRVIELPGLNHLLQTCTTGLPDEYGTIEETIAPAALDTMTTWIVAHANARAGLPVRAPRR